MNITYRELKTKRLNEFSFQGLNDFHAEVRLMEPPIDFEPTVFIRVVYRATKDSVYSIQFQAENPALYHYMNFMSDSDFRDGEIVEKIIISDLPLDHRFDWTVVMFSPQITNSQAIKKFSFNILGMWEEQNIFNSETSRINLGLYGMGDLDYVLIGGSPKSGTTWVERIINAHPDALATGENNFFQWPRRVMLQKLMADSPPVYFSYAVRQSPPFQSQAAILYTARAKLIMEQLGNIAHVSLVADKSPANTNFIPEMRALLPTWKYIHCVRNPLDVLVSRFFHELNLLRDSPELSAFYISDRKDLIKSIDSYNKKQEKIGSMFSNIDLLKFLLTLTIESNEVLHRIRSCENGMLIYYEDLLDNFNDTCTSLLHFCELVSDEETVKKLKIETGFKKFSKGRNVGDPDSTSFFRKGIKGDHLNYLTEEQIVFVRNRIKDVPIYARYM